MQCPMKLPCGSHEHVAALVVALMVCCPSNAGESRWIRLQTPDFEIYSSAGPRTARDVIHQFEQVRSFFLQLSRGSTARPAPVRLVVFGSAKEFARYRPNEIADAYYQETPDRDYIVMSRGSAETFPIAVHEYVHLLVRHADLKLPPWLNEGLAELFSTLRPMKGKILVGGLIAARYQALLRDPWVPLGIILAADQNSPYYNEKNKAGSLYNEGWALTHMLYLRAEYRPLFGQFLRSISAGKDSAQVLQEVYGGTVPEIEKSLQAYLRGGSFQGVLFPAKLNKIAGEIPSEPLADFDVQLMYAELMTRPGKEAAQQELYESLVRQNPKRPEPYRGLGYLALHRSQPEEAIEQFGKAFARGDRDPKWLWDYGRLLELDHGEDAIRVLSELLSQEPGRMDVRLELAEAQARASQPKAALVTLAPIRSVKPEDAARFFRIAVYAYLQNGERGKAEAAAQHFLDIAKSDKDRSAAEQLVSQAAFPRPEPAGRPTAFDIGKPRLRHGEAAAPPRELVRRPETPSSVSGRFVQLLCEGKQARMVIETAAGQKVFLIDDPGKVAITSGSHGPVDLVCGPQKKPVTVQIGYETPAIREPGVDGIVRTVAF
jgi:tetratricopeptide (TPR) repeat protein